MLTILVTFVVTTGLYGGLLVLVGRRIARHCQNNEAATRAVTEHVLLPILGKEKAVEAKTLVQKKGTLI